jgi:hypothetical protein
MRARANRGTTVAQWTRAGSEVWQGSDPALPDTSRRVPIWSHWSVIMACGSVMPSPRCFRAIGRDPAIASGDILEKGRNGEIAFAHDDE